MRSGSIDSPGIPRGRRLLAGSTAVAIGVLLILFLPLSAGAMAAECTDTWVGPSAGAWQTAGNWSSGVPTSSDIACIGSGEAALISSGITAEAAAVQGEGRLIMDATLVLAGSAEPSNIGVLEMYGGLLTGAGDLEISKELSSYFFPHMAGSGTTVIQEGATAQTSYEPALKGRRLVNEGTFTVASGTIVETEGAEVVNRGTFILNSGAETVVRGISSEDVFVNRGTFQQAIGEPHSVSTAFRNEGNVEVLAGSLSFRGGGISSGGDWEAIEGSELVFTGGRSYSFTGGNIGGVMDTDQFGTSVQLESVSFDPGSLLNLASTLDIPSGSATIPNIATYANAEITGGGDLEISEELLITRGLHMHGAGSTVILEGAAVNTTTFAEQVLIGRKLVNEGAYAQTDGPIYEMKGSEILNLGTFTDNAGSSTILHGESAADVFVNRGTFQKTAGGETHSVEPSFVNAGVIHETSGHFDFKNPVTAESGETFSKECHGGDPVNCATGDFSEGQTDIAIAGLGVGLNLTRTYSAQAASAGSPGTFGYGWSSSFSDHLVSEEGGNRITLVSGDGSTVPFTKSGAAYKAPTWSQDTLGGSTEAGFTLVLPRQVEYGFSGSGRLDAVTDRNGNETALGYKEGRLETITDPAGRKITLTYNGGGQVEGAEDPMGHLVKYGYESGQLISVTLPGEAEPRWRFKYDGSHRITQVADGRGGKTKNEYDGSSRVISQTDPAERTTTFEYTPFHTTITNKATGAVTDEWFTSDHEPFSITRGSGTTDATTETFSYNAAGLLISKIDGNGNKTIYGYDAHGNRASEKDAAGDETKWTFNETHDVVSTTTPEGEKTTIARDVNGNAESVSRPGTEETTQTSTFAHDAQGQLESTTDPLERTWTYGYDAQGDRTSETDPLGDTATSEYDEDSRLIAITSPRGNVEGTEAAKFTTRIERDSEGRPEEVIDPLGHSTSYTYDPNGNLETQTDANGRTTTYRYNADDERTEVEKPVGAVFKTGYDSAGDVASQTDANEETTTYIRNALGEPIEVIDPLKRVTTEEFDAAGNLRSVIDPAERQTSYAYDPANRLTEVSYSDGTTPKAEFEYNPDGNVTKMVDGTGESSFEYDRLGRLTESKDGHGDVVGYEYDIAEEPIGLTYPNGKAITRQFDEAGRLENLTDWVGGTTTFSYDPSSNLKSITFPAGSDNVDEYAYDRADRMSGESFDKGAESLASISYTREKVGQVEGEARNGMPGSEKLHYGYDEDDRMIEAGGASFEYDPADNLTKAPGTANSYDAASQLESGTGIAYSYNQLGERTKATPVSGPATAYGYDQAANLISVERPEEGEVQAIGESLGYDGTGLMTSETSGIVTEYLTWDQSGGLPLLLADGQNNYIYGPNSLPVEQISSEEEPTYLHHDQLGSTRLLTNAIGETAASFSYNSYGGLEGHTGSATTPLGFAGQYTDPHNGLQYLRARFYDPTTRQFLTKDPVAAVTGEPYGYSNENPLRYIDPTGMSCLSVGHYGPIEYPSVDPGDCVEDAVGGAAEDVVSAGSWAFNHPSLVTAPIVFAACVIEPEICTTAAAVGALSSGAAAGIRAANECKSVLQAEIDSLLVTLAAALPGGVFEATAGRAGPELAPIARRILQALLDAPGLGAELAHGAKGH